MESPGGLAASAQDCLALLVAQQCHFRVSHLVPLTLRIFPKSIPARRVILFSTYSL